MNTSAYLKQFGVPKDNVHLLDEPRWSNVEYRDLIEGIALQRGGPRNIKPVAVVEANSEPLLYVVPATMVQHDPNAHINAVNLLRVKLSTRAKGAYIALAEPGKLTLYSVGLDDSLPAPIVRLADGSTSTLFSELSAGLEVRSDATLGQQTADKAAFRDKLFNLLIQTSQELLKVDGLKGEVDDVLSLMGRALFARFLIDRGVLTKLSTGADAVECFSNAANAVATCEWMDEVFNGDLLELTAAYPAFFRGLGAKSDAFYLLTNIVKGLHGGQFEFPLWGEIDFSHVPVGLLSEVYERLAHDLAGDHAAAESIHYTPRNIAAYMVDQAFSGLPKNRRASARCLDPAAGGGVFLVLCYRRLVAERWRADGAPPSRKMLREIIENQIRGFDINLSALKLAALGLYLSAIELDPNPRKAGDRKFKPMQGSVLLHVRGDNEPHPNSYILGSLGPLVDQSHCGQYQVVIGNPPWTSWELRKAGERRVLLKQAAEEIVRRVASQRAQQGLPEAQKRLAAIADHYTHPDYVPDLPFAWRAMEWAAPGGVIALAMHARLLFRPIANDNDGRSALFAAMRVTGILNGAMLRQTDVWPNVDAQWCLLFALNEVPHDQHTLFYVSPELDPGLNVNGRMRVDYHSAHPIEAGVLREKPYLLKTLFRGTSIDAGILKRVMQVGIPLGRYCDEQNLIHGDGYQVFAGGTDSDFLWGLPNLTPKTWRRGRKVDVSALPTFDVESVHRTRRMELYQAPLLIVPEALPASRDKGGIVVVQDGSVAFSESYFGYSAAGVQGGLSLIRYLHALCHSALLYHFVVMTSAKFGIERDLINKHDLDSFPVVPFDKLSEPQRQQAQALSHAIEEGASVFAELDRWAAGVYGLDARDVDALRDALDIAMPFRGCQKRALKVTTAAEREIFRSVMKELLPPLFKLIERDLWVEHVPSASDAWKYVRISAEPSDPPAWRASWIEHLAQDEGASAVFVHQGPHLILGVRDQYRYWTRTRARLCAHEIVSKHADAILAIDKA